MTQDVRNAAVDAGNAAVIVAHPGHELLIYHWIERHQPLYCCLTDGSGGSATSRLASSTRLLERVGATPGPLYGRYPDKDVYRLLLDRRVDVFIGLAKELAAVLTSAGVDCVAGDAVEGFNPVHDVCRILVDGAVAMVRERTGRVIRNYDFVLDAPPDGCPDPLRDGALVLRLDEAALGRKTTAALAYPEMRDEVQAALERFGRQAFAVECLRPARTMTARFDREAPTYEGSGQIRVNEGLYREIIRYREHVFPVLRAIEDAAE